MISRREMSLALAAMIVMVAIMAVGAMAAEYYVDGSVAESGDGSSWDDAFKTIQEGIDACADGTCDTPDVVHVAEGTYTENVVMDSYMTLLGGYPEGGGDRDPGAHETIIDGDANGSVVTIDTKDCITIDGFTITNGSSSAGGGIHCYCGSPKLTNCTISGNSAVGYGGGIACWDNSEPVIDGCVISDNMLESGGYGGGLYDCDGPISDCTITGNSAGDGGGLYGCDGTISTCIINGNTSDFVAHLHGGGGLYACNGTIKDCSIRHNYCDGYGGGLCYCCATIDSCDISENVTGRNGGGLKWCNGTITGSVISGNYECGLANCEMTISDCTISDNSGHMGAGLNECSGSMNDCLIARNSAVTGGGGVARFIGTVTACVVSDNSAEGGGGLWGCEGEIANCTIADNSVSVRGGGLEGCIGTIASCVIEDNSAAEAGGGMDLCEGTINGCTITGNSAGSFGGGLSNCGWTAGTTILDCTIAGNAATDFGGGVCISPGTFRNCKITGNSADSGGGVSHGEVTMINCIISSNAAAHLGGGLYSHYSYGSPRLTNCTIGGNEASSGGGFWCDGPSCEPEFVNCILWGNSPDEIAGDTEGTTVSYSDVKGGWSGTGTGNINEDPLFVEGYYLSHTATGEADDSPCIDRGSDTAANLGLDDRTTRVDGVYDTGQVDMGYHHERGSPDRYVDVVNGDDGNMGFTWDDAFATIQKAIDASIGGTCEEPDVIHVAEGTYVENIVLDSNITMLGGYPPGGGARDPEAHETTINGGMISTAITVDTNDCVSIDGFTMIEGLADNGGGIYCDNSSPTIANCTIFSNGADCGGGIYCHNGSPTITNCMISDNGAFSYGAGIFCEASGSPTLTDCTLYHNNAAYTGGGIWCNSSSSPTLTNCTLDNNIAGGAGGGIWCNSSSPPTLTNCTLIDNFAGYTGGGISCEDFSSATLTNCTLTDNTAMYGGGGIHSKFSSSPTLTNCTLCGNESQLGSGGGILTHSSSSPTLTNCILTDNKACNYGGSILCAYDSVLTLSNCTIADNQASSGGGIWCDDSSCEAKLLNCILWGDSPDEVSGDTTNLTVSYCDVDQDGYAGSDGNIRKDPGFVPLDGDGNHIGYYLMHLGPQAKDSACINAGDNTAAYYGLDALTTRTDGVHDSGTVDMGYHYPDGYTGSGNTYIELISFTAEPQGKSIVLNWETGAEIENAGFVVYRTIAGTLDYQRLSGLIPARGTPTSGASYSFTDSNSEPGVGYDYWLVDIETSGKWTVHGPAACRLPPLTIEPISEQNLMAFSDADTTPSPE